MIVSMTEVREIAQRAIHDRLGWIPQGSIISVEPDLSEHGRDFQAVILHVNSGDNAAACRIALGQAGYLTELTEYNLFARGNYGVHMRVRRAP
jgi:hypothetical protein